MPTPNYDNTLWGKYIMQIENPDMQGYSLVQNKWYDPTWLMSSKDTTLYDHNNRGYGMDVVHNKPTSKLVTGRDGKWLTSEEENQLRNAHIDEVQKAIARKYDTYPNSRNMTPRMRAMATGVLYRGDADELWTKGTPMNKAYAAGDDNAFDKALQTYYESKKMPQRVKNHKTFWNKQKADEEAQQRMDNLNPIKLTSEWADGWKNRMDEGGPLSKWEDLSIREKAAYMQTAIDNNITNLNDIREAYNKFAEGGYINNVQETQEANRDYGTNVDPSRIPNIYAGGGSKTRLASLRQKLASYGITNPVHQDAILANIYVESGGNINAQNPNSSARGLLQWTQARYPGAWDEDSQLRYIASTYNHLGGNDWQNKDAYNRFMNTTNPIEAARLFRRYYERPEAYTYNWTDRYFNNNGGISNSGMLDQDMALQDLNNQIGDTIGFTPANPEVFAAAMRGEYQVPTLDDIDVQPIAPYTLEEEPAFVQANPYQGIQGVMRMYDALNGQQPWDTTYAPVEYDPSAPYVVRTYGDGGKIYIKPSHRGRLTELKKRTGKTEAELYNDGNPAHRKMVQFARNSRKWHHADGGFLNAFLEDNGENTTFVRENNHPVAFDNEGNLTDQVTGEKGVMMAPGVTVTQDGRPLGYRYNSAFDGSLGNFMDVTNVLTGGMANRLSPTQNARFIYDAATGGDWVNSWFGNNGVTSDKFAQEHPYLSMGTNVLLDAAFPSVGYGVSKMNGLKTSPKSSMIFMDRTPAFMSELDWSPESWFKTRGSIGYDKEDVDALLSHVPEYTKIEQQAKVNGTWLKNADGTDWEGSPREWVMLQSQAAQKLSPDFFYSGREGTRPFNPSYRGEVWGTNNLGTAYTYKGPHGTMTKLYYPAKAKVSYYDGQHNYWKNIPSTSQNSITTNDVRDALFSPNQNTDIIKITNVKDPGPNGFINLLDSEGTDYIIKDGVVRKSILGNNGNFDFTNPNIYKGIVPLSMFGIGLNNK